MRFLGDASALGSAAAFAARHTGGAATNPALAGLRMVAEGSSVRMSGYDYEAATAADTPVEVAEPGEILVPGKVFAEILQSLPDTRPIRVRAADNGVEIVSGDIEFTLPTLPSDDYPELPATPSSIGTVDAEAFTRAAHRMAKIAARDDVVPIFAGTLIEFGAETLTLASSDRYRLAVCDLVWSGPALEKQVIVPARVFADTAKGLMGKGDLTLGVATGSDSLLGISDASRSATLRLLDGVYPAMRGKIPTEFAGSITVRAEDLRAALRRVCIVADRFTAVVLTIAADGVVVGAAGDVDTRGRERVHCTLEGDGVVTSFNAGYLLDGLDFLDADEVRFAFAEGIRPALLTTPEHPGAQYVVLPRRMPA